MNSIIFAWLIYASWLILLVYLIVAAAGTKHDTGEHPLRNFGILFVVIISFMLPHIKIFRFLNFDPVSSVQSCIGVILCFTGLGINIWGRQQLGKNWSRADSTKGRQKLVISGPYSYIRHPMYSGGFLAILGSAVVMGGAWIFLLVFLGPIFFWRVGAEDRLLEQQFPDEYPEYKKRTKALIPFVW
ncbi:MAG: isoprenylcysteine carboxylmethyltransferase family protein [Ignavibacteriaceae bacterium]|jgi:protein-S-isoprenylcysteine O-methyltransferase